MEESLLYYFMNPAEINVVQNAAVKDRRHPLTRLLFPNENGSYVNANTNRAIRAINGRYKDFIPGLKPRLLNVDDYSESASALSEIRAFGYLLLAGIKVTPLKTDSVATPDFLITDNGREIHVEVFSKQMDATEAIELEAFKNKPLPLAEGETEGSKIHAVYPFGRPNKKGERPIENIIQRVAGIKQSETQFSEKNTSILWVDFQDETWNLTPGLRSLIPISSWRGDFYSGGLWFAFYGWKGAPLLFGEPKYPTNNLYPVSLQHSGRFREETKIDYVFWAFPNHTVAFENPVNNKPFSDDLWWKLVDIPWFNIEYSLINWPERNLKLIIQHQKETILKLANRLIEENG